MKGDGFLSPRGLPRAMQDDWLDPKTIDEIIA
jgi:hypothetical protein